MRPFPDPYERSWRETEDDLRHSEKPAERHYCLYHIKNNCVVLERELAPEVADQLNAGLVRHHIPLRWVTAEAVERFAKKENPR